MCGPSSLLLEKLNMAVVGGGRLDLGPGEGEVMVGEEQGGRRALGRISYLWRPGQGEQRQVRACAVCAFAHLHTCTPAHLHTCTPAHLHTC